jgi:hypothetical protein
MEKFWPTLTPARFFFMLISTVRTDSAIKKHTTPTSHTIQKLGNNSERNSPVVILRIDILTGRLSFAVRGSRGSDVSSELCERKRVTATKFPSRSLTVHDRLIIV